MRNLALQTVSKFRAALPSHFLPKRLRGGRLERWGNYWTTLFKDYQDSITTIVKDSKARPLKTALYLGALAAALELNATNPNERDLKSQLLEEMNELSMISYKILDKNADQKMIHMKECFANGTMRRLNLFLFSLAWEDNYHRECTVYKASVSHLKPRYLTFFQDRVLDIGIYGRWRYLDYLVKYGDINDDEWDKNGKQKPEYSFGGR